MKCPHCGIGISWQPLTRYLLGYEEAEAEEEEDDQAEESESESGESYENPFSEESVVWDALCEQCPECSEPIILIRKGVGNYVTQADKYRFQEGGYSEEYMVWPRAGSRTCAPEVPSNIREDFEEASEVLDISPKASAALSRRCLQHLLTEHAGMKKKDLAHQIEELIATNKLSSDLASQLDAVRNIGNFAAHPQKAISSGEILPVEPHEAEWNLDVLEELFDYFFVKPAKAKARREELNKKLSAAGKPLLP
jgi:hypothetical protein